MFRPATLRQPVSAFRQLSTSAVRRDAVGTVGAPVVPRRPVGGFRGGILGFFLGFSAASGLAIYYLQQEAKLASSLLMQSVEELQQGTGKTRVIVVVVGVIVVLRTPLASLALLPLVPGSDSLGRLMVILAYEVLVIPVSSARDKTISALPNSNLELNRLPASIPRLCFQSSPTSTPTPLRSLS
ncbi:hypothetical protein EHS25_002760 [Saitozyma podzolica]|uniref:Uncharacterized protein n=1 Tax=Saitozyma podzolica TaxID=1890683 RepID=A0A427YDQ7_9TREE|nr:hypothetical protein EHS25_002760 [Saitozyma podzolica]